MIGIAFDLLVGIVVGIEQDSGDEDDDYHWLIAINLGIIRIMIINFKPDN